MELSQRFSLQKAFLARAVNSEMLKLENRKERPPDSVDRYVTIYDTLKQYEGKIDIRTAQEILSNHSGHVCFHVNSIQLGTLWSIVATLNNLQILRAEGHPRRTKYGQDTRLNKTIQTRQKTIKPIE